MDSLFLIGVAAAGLVGWLLCYRNPNVHWAWRTVLVWPAVITLSVYIFFGLFGARMALWNDATMDRPVLLFALAPILAWPVRKRAGAQADPLQGILP